MEALAAWVSRWQVIVGLVMFTTQLLVVILQTCVFRAHETVTTKGSKTPEEERDEVNKLTIFRFGDSIMWQLLVFGSLKSSPAAALAVCMVMPLILCVFTIFFCATQLRAAKEERRASILVVESLMPTSVYTDIHLGNMLQCLAIFGGQVMLYSFVLQGVLEREAYANGSVPAKSTGFFVAGAFVSFMQEIVDIIQDQWRIEWEKFWSVYFGKPGFRTRVHWPLSRVTMSFLVNCYFQKTMLCVLPLALMDSSNSMEFVKDATSILFISKIDDILFSWSHHVPLRPNRRDEFIAEPELSNVAHSDADSDANDVSV